MTVAIEPAAHGVLCVLPVLRCPRLPKSPRRDPGSWLWEQCKRMMLVTLNATYYCDMGTPIGPLLLVGRETRLAAIYFQSGPRPKTVRPEWIRTESPFQIVVRQLEEYFAGRLRHFDVPLESTGTPFQRAVWHELTQIPYGGSTSYGEIARRIGHPLASRAVGRANGANPWPIVVPCHRVIGANHSLTGFGGGLETKRRLLLLEAEAAGPSWLSPRDGRAEDSNAARDSSVAPMRFPSKAAPTR
jgi:methylated-DNA-[protein]-cysteine S-methyltransferase